MLFYIYNFKEEKDFSTLNMQDALAVLIMGFLYYKQYSVYQEVHSNYVFGIP